MVDIIFFTTRACTLLRGISRELRVIIQFIVEGDQEFQAFWMKAWGKISQRSCLPRRSPAAEGRRRVDPV